MKIRPRHGRCKTQTTFPAVTGSPKREKEHNMNRVGSRMAIGGHGHLAPGRQGPSNWMCHATYTHATLCKEGSS
jgi:hypothetical protein